jgi:hypothetical protein
MNSVGDLGPGLFVGRTNGEAASACRGLIMRLHNQSRSARSLSRGKRLGWSKGGRGRARMAEKLSRERLA